MLQNKWHNEPKQMEATAKRCVRNELSLKAKLDVIRDSTDKSHRQLA